MLIFVLAVYSSSDCKFVLYQGKQRSFCVFNHVVKGGHGRYDPSSKRQRHFEDEICFPGMFYDLLFKMLALFERLADSCYSTYK